MSDVERCGFFDDHLWPMTHYFASLAAAKVDPAAVGLMYTDKLESELPRAVWGETGGRRRSVSHSMVTGGSSWSKVLVSTAHNRSDANHDLALEVTQRICALVAADYACFPFEPPPACAAALAAAARARRDGAARDEPKPYPAPLPEEPLAAVVAARAMAPTGDAPTCGPGPAADPLERLLAAYAELESQWLPVCKSNLQPDFNVISFDSFDARFSAVLQELDESDRFVQKSAESTSI